jgi:transposase
MSQNNNPKTVYLGIDVAKASFQLDGAGQSMELPNTPSGHARLLRWLGPAEGQQVILEASGGYEQPLVRAVRARGFAVSVVDPARVRWFARAIGLRAKTDPIDAALIRLFGEKTQPRPTPAPSLAQTRLAALVSRRRQLVELQTMERNHAEHYEDAWVRRQSLALQKTLQGQIERCEKEIHQLMAADEMMRARSARLQQVPGVGALTSATLQAFLPELGAYADESIAALAGVVPYNHDSGRWAGSRRIGGGRPAVRSALYMAALSASRHDAILKAFYQRLIRAGKKPLVALTAVMRKLVVLLNRLLRNPHFLLRPNPPFLPKNPDLSAPLTPPRPST